MFMLRIEHRARSYDEWKKQFDNDPIGRERSGVRRYRVMRLVDDPNRVMIDLEFDSERDARAAHEKLKDVWRRVGDGMISEPQARVFEAVEVRDLKPSGAPMDK